MNDKYIKLLIGILLFATLVALTVLQVHGAERLVDLIYAALLGLGINHLSSAGNDSAQPADKQAGRTQVWMLAVLAMVGLMLAGCASVTGQATTQSTQVSYTQACATYGAAFAGALELRRAGRLNRPQIDQVTLLDSQITPICTGALPADPVAAIQQVTAAVATLTILEVARKGN